MSITMIIGLLAICLAFVQVSLTLLWYVVYQRMIRLEARLTNLRIRKVKSSRREKVNSSHTPPPLPTPRQLSKLKTVITRR